MVDNFFVPENARVDITSSTFGRAADYEEDVVSSEEKNMEEHSNYTSSAAVDFSLTTAGKPMIEPIFGTQYWSHRIPQYILNKWSEAAAPRLPSKESLIDLPPINPFIPKAFDLKPLPADDSHHPLLFCSLKLCISVGKKKVNEGNFSDSNNQCFFQLLSKLIKLLLLCKLNKGLVPMYSK